MDESAETPERVPQVAHAPLEAGQVYLYKVYIAGSRAGSVARVVAKETPKTYVLGNQRFGKRILDKARFPCDGFYLTPEEAVVGTVRDRARRRDIARENLATAERNLSDMEAFAASQWTISDKLPSVY